MGSDMGASLSVGNLLEKTKTPPSVILWETNLGTNLVTRKKISPRRRPKPPRKGTIAWVAWPGWPHLPHGLRIGSESTCSNYSISAPWTPHMIRDNWVDVTNVPPKGEC
ncbi:unnamed protein product [Darwinula stevensoni]|uniref:Uncharacterized protein n=1 Tax=Darwinula stevensoni TaxID=69355 RepID=A0A7R8X8R0_9CRUS|nr:unnamed protein product [Darwinula stevensoni]CAG0888964.1 unnamed protein product [Darwinula stevensoni]